MISIKTFLTDKKYREMGIDELSGIIAGVGRKALNGKGYDTLPGYCAIDKALKLYDKWHPKRKSRSRTDSQCGIILSHLRRYGSITSVKIGRISGSMYPARRIGDLREGKHDGTYHIIDTVKIPGKRYCRFTFRKEKKNEDNKN